MASVHKYQGGRDGKEFRGNKKLFLYSMKKEEETGNVIICPMNGENHITIHGAEEAKFFTSQILDYYQTT